MNKDVTILSLVGTSLLSNFGDPRRCPSGADFLKSIGLEDISRLDINDPKQQAVLTYKNQLIDKLLYFIENSNDPKSTSAELNTILSFIDKKKIKNVRIFLFATNTNNAQLVAEVIKKYLEKRNYYVDIITVDFRNGFEDGLLDLLQKVFRRVLEEKKVGRVVVVAATPGFKPESTYATIAAMLAGADKAIYIHEAMHQLVELPLMAVEISPDVLKELERLPQKYSPEKHDRLLDSGVAKLREDQMVIPTEFGRKLYDLFIAK